MARSEGAGRPAWSALALAIVARRVATPTDASTTSDDDLAAARDVFAASLSEPTPFGGLAHNGGLSTIEAEILAVAVAVEADPGLAAVVARLDGQSAPSHVTLHALAQLFPDDADAIVALGPDGALRSTGFVDLVADGPWARSLVVVHPTLMWALSGDASADPDLPVGAELHDGPADGANRFVTVTGDDPQRRLETAMAASAGQRFLVTPLPETDAQWSAVVREATIIGAGVVVDLDGVDLPPIGRRWIERAAHLVWVISSRVEPPLEVLPIRPWTDLHAASSEPTDLEWTTALGDMPRSHRLTASQLLLVGRVAAANGADVDAAVRRLAGGHIDRLARRIRPTRGWDDLVLSPDRTQALHDLVARDRHADVVYDRWGFAGAPSRGQVALFSGPSGTGKTLTAEIIAGELGLDLFKLDLSAVVSKYIGETEKNLDRVFDAARAGNVVLFFDEADALFGKRSEVTDARDRYANIEVSYLLQRLEAYDGLVILATNFERNIDDAFLRRIHVRVEFALPDEAERLAIWEHNLPASAPLAADVDLPFLARQFEFSGGSIRNAALQAAFQAAAADTSIGMAALIRGVAREYQKLGRLLSPADFAEYHPLVTAPRPE